MKARLLHLLEMVSAVLILSVLIWIGMSVVSTAQTQSTLTIGGFTINVPSANPTVLVNAPSRNGTLALKEDLPPPAPPATVFAGQFTINGSATFTGTSGPFICTLTPRFTTTNTGLQVAGIDYVCTQKNN